MRKQHLVAALMAVALSGCAAAWLNDPSPATVNLINDLKLEGFECKAGFSSVECRQITAYIEKSPMICTSSTGCVPQPCLDVRIVYDITQAKDGIPGIVQTVERTVTRSIPPGDVYSEARRKDLEAYCSLK